MKLSLENIDLTNILKIASEVIEGKNGVQKTKERLGNTVTIETNDEDMKVSVVNLTSDIRVAATVNNMGTNTNVSFNSLNEVERALKHFNKDLFTVLESGNEELIFTSGEKKLSVPFTNDKIEPIVFEEEYKEYEYNTSELYRRIKKVNKIRTKDLSRPMLEGIYFNESDIVALDGYMLGVTTDDTLNVENGFIIDNVTINVLLKLLNRKDNLPVIIQVSDKHIRFIFQNIIFTSKLIEEKYFNYKDIIRKDFNITLDLNTKQLLKDLKYLNELNKDNAHRTIKLTTSDLTLATESLTSSASVTLDTEIKRSEERNLKLVDQIAFNGYMMQQLINEVNSDTITIGLVSSVNPIMINESKNEMQLLLPVRLT